MYLILGSIFDTVAAMVITLPFVFPLILDLGFDPIWFGVINVMVIEIGMITPPIGINVFVLHGIAREVRLVELPELPAKGDVSDWLQAEGTAETLKRLVHQSPLFEPSDEPPATLTDREKPLDLADFHHAGLIPAAVYDLLPQTLRRICTLLRPDHERDVFLTGALPTLAACLPEVLLRCGRHWQGLNLYTCAVAPAGAGKSTLTLARCLGERVDDRLFSASMAALETWENDAGEERGPRPLLRRLLLAGNYAARGKRLKISKSHAEVSCG